MAPLVRALSLLLLAAASTAHWAPALAQRTSERPNDLAAQVEGTYHGDVISDARGSSREGVTITVTRVGPNQVEVSSDYRRIPTVRIRIEQAMSAIVQADGDYVFLIQRDSDPDMLNLTIDDASLAVRRR
ncbi:hypothetical protein [Sphingosinicella terrae]|uniref:hypothetical protein n=1 Tax=Sphingosinicella terrae TaxID=2172047 RepID=UPI000E0CF3BB|nr:hypothetical protein [Sphingosinicella terrae]